VGSVFLSIKMKKMQGRKWGEGMQGKRVAGVD
jgi:hypothetical protein